MNGTSSFLGADDNFAAFETGNNADEARRANVTASRTRLIFSTIECVKTDTYSLSLNKTVKGSYFNHMLYDFLAEKYWF